MRAHGFRGAAELTATPENIAALAHLSGVVPPHLFDPYSEATLGRASIVDFIARYNPAASAASAALCDTVRRLRNAGLWVLQSNPIAARLERTQ